VVDMGVVLELVHTLYVYALLVIAIGRYMSTMQDHLSYEAFQ